MTQLPLASMCPAVAGADSYHPSQKAVPREAGPQVVLFHVYPVASALCLVVVLSTEGRRHQPG